jgi:hypothetical protein
MQFRLSESLKHQTMPSPTNPFIQDVFVDSGRSSLFSQVKIETALAVPVFSGKSNTPSFVFCCYSFVRVGSVPFVLKFVQQALRLLWDGLDKVQPHQAVGEELWKDVAPADLGEMAADVEMQQHFIIKKRPRTASMEIAPTNQRDPTGSSLAMGFESLGTPSGAQSVRSIYTGPGSGPDQQYDENHYDDDFEPNVVPIHFQPVQRVQNHIQQAVQSIRDLNPAHHHIATNSQGSKRAHIVIERLDSPVEFDTAPSQPEEARPAASNSRESHFMAAPAPLPMPRPLPLPNATLRPVNGLGTSASPQLQPIQTRPLAPAPAQQQGQNYQATQPTSQNYQMQNHQQLQPMYFSQQQNTSADSNAGSLSYAPHNMMQQAQVSNQQQQQQPQHGNYASFSAHPGQPISEPSYDMGYGQHSQVVNGMGYSGQQQPQQQGYSGPQQPQQPQQQGYSGQQQPQQHQYNNSLQSNEPLSLPPDFGQAPNYASQPVPGAQQQSSMPQTGYSSMPSNKISATGMVFSLRQANQGAQLQGNGVRPTNGAGQVAPGQVSMAPNNGNNNLQFGVVVVHASSSASGNQTSSKVCADCRELSVV